MRRKLIYFLSVFTFLMILSGKALAQTREEVVLNKVKDMVLLVLADLKANKATYQNDPSALNRMIDEKVSPYFDTEAMARLVLARSWKSATSQQRQAFIDEFKALIMRTYSSSLLGYTDAKIMFAPPKKIKRNRTKIDVTIISGARKKFDITVSMGYRENQWRAYDISLNGLSAITSYRGSIGDEIATKGLTGVLDDIKALNAKGAVISQQSHK